MTDEQQARTDARASVQGFNLVPLTQAIIDEALASMLPDFEDNIQMISAKTIAAGHLITRNKKHFQSAPVSILTPEEWLVLENVVAIEETMQT